VLRGAAGAPSPASALHLGVLAAISLVLIVLVFVLAWLGWASLVRRLRSGTRPDPDAAGLAGALIALAVGLIAWLSNPLSALLIIPALHVFIALSTPQLRPRRALGSLGLLMLALLPLALVAAFYASALDAGPAGAAYGALLLFAGGHIGPAAALLWSLALGCWAGALIAAVSAEIAPPPAAAKSPGEIRFMVRGPLTYAGPGSLGGTESALRR
jgi:hypothetical protein